MLAKNLEETQKIAGDFVRDLSPKGDIATVVGLYGDLGAGKTSFTQGVAKALNISESIVSPTFIIMKFYPVSVGGFDNMIHIDAYRLDKPEELLFLNWQEIISNPKNLVLIEWPERVSSIMPEHIKINFSHIESDGRKIDVLTP